MNKELNEKLRGVGFGNNPDSSGLYIKINPDFEFICYDDSDFYGFKKGDYITGMRTTSRLGDPSFKKVIEFIKTQTGVDLTLKVKKSKRKEIDALKQQIKELDLENKNQAEFMCENLVRIQKLENKRKSNQQPERVRILKVKATGVDWEVGEIAKVVIRSGNILLLQKENYDRKDWFNIDEVTEQLYADPVESDLLEFGSNAVIIDLTHEGGVYTFSNGDVVRVGVKDKEGGNYICDNQNGCAWVNPKNLKPQ